MSKNEKSQFMGQAAAASAPNMDMPFIPCAPPPTYEESQKTNKNAAASYPNLNGAQPAVVPAPVYHPHYQQQYHQQYPQIPPYYQQQTTQVYHQQNLYQQPAPSTSYAAIPISSSSQIPSNIPVINFAKGAKITTNANGAVSVPPPPPGCAPTHEQLAAMQGKPVVIKTKKRSFFSS